MADLLKMVRKMYLKSELFGGNEGEKSLPTEATSYFSVKEHHFLDLLK